MNVASTIILLICAIASHSLYAYPLQATFFSSAQYAYVEGLAQTPRGGEKGSSSLNRPTFEELNIHQDAFYTAGISIAYYDYFALISYTHFDPHGNTILAEELTTHSQSISVGQIFDMDCVFNWYSLGFGKNFTLSQNWLISPAFALNWVKYHYEYAAPPLRSARTFSLVGTNAELKIQYYFTCELWANLQVSIPFLFSNIKIRSLEVGVGFDLPLSYVTLSPKLSIGWLELDYKDEQTLPNHIRYCASPYGSLAMALLFD